MTPAARVAAAIGILDRVIAGQPAEQVLTQWARANRYAGSGDRAAIRDHVFDALRCRRSYAWIGGAESGRGLMIGALRSAGTAPEAVFSGEGYAPAPLSTDEAAAGGSGEMPEAVRLDCPDWLLPHFRESLGAEAEPVLRALRRRAPVFLRVNLRKTTLNAAIQDLAGAGIGTRPHALSATALEVIDNPRKIQASAAYKAGNVELQDAASQAVVGLITLRNGLKLLDYCAGGGGKSLAIAAQVDVAITAHDVNRQRMHNLPRRAERAGVSINIAESRDALLPAGYDVVLCDAPCSGSGAWRRAPKAKWTLTPERLHELTAIQAEILDKATGFVAPGGRLVYITCSLLRDENEEQIARFLARERGWTLETERRFTPLDGGDGFYIAQLTSGS